MIQTTLLCTVLFAASAPAAPETVVEGHREEVQDPWIRVAPEDRRRRPARRFVAQGQVSIQVNVDAFGNNILGDAANEPSLAVDANDPRRIVVGWRQFDSIQSNFRQAGYGSTANGGEQWATGVIEPGIFRSDPVLGVDREGVFYYYSLSVTSSYYCDTFRSLDGGTTWSAGVYSYGGDKSWLEIDRSAGLGDGHLYTAWTPGLGCCGDDRFNRSTDGGQSFEYPIAAPSQPVWGTITVGPEGEVYLAGSTGSSFAVARSSTLRDPGLAMAFDGSSSVDLGGSQRISSGPNPGGLLGQVWIDVDRSAGPRRGNVYLLASVDPPGADPLDVHFVRSTDGGLSWSAPLRIHDDPPGTGAWHWFGTLAVAPSGRIDAIWNDTRNDPGGYQSELYYSFSQDGGVTWSADQAVSPPFDPHLGWPQQNKLGDYYDMVSADDAVHVAYAATFNGEQDVYYLRLVFDGIFADGFEGGDTAAWSATTP